MKKTLFLASLIAACSLPPAHAAEPEIQVDFGSGAYISGDLVIDSENADSYINSHTFTQGSVLNNSAGVNVGHCLGEGSMTVKDGASVATPNNLYIGGTGYWNTATPDWYSATYNDGTVYVRNGGTLTVGVQNTSGDGTQLNLANTNGKATGSLIVEDGGTVHANARTAIGGGAGTGVLKVSGEGSSVDFARQGIVTDAYLFLYTAMGTNSKAEITVEDHARFVCSGDTIASYAYIGRGGETTIKVTGGSEMVLPKAGQGTTVIGFEKGAHTTVEVDDSTLTAGTVYTGYASGTSTSISLKNGAVMSAYNVVMGIADGNDDSLQIATGAGLTTGGLTLGDTGAAHVENAGNIQAQEVYVKTTSVLNNSGTFISTITKVDGNGKIDNSGYMGLGYLGVGGTASVSNSGTVIAGDVEVVGSGSISNSGVLGANNIVLSGSGKFTNEDGGTVAAQVTALKGPARIETDSLHVSKDIVLGSYNTVTLVNLKADAAGTLACTDLTVENGSVYNYGLLDAQSGIKLGDGAYLLTGTLTVAGKEDVANNGDPATLEYSTGLTEGTKVTVTGTEDVTVGAVVTSKTGNTQYVSGDDLKAMDAKVLEGLALTAAPVKVINELDSTVQASLTTGEVNDKTDSVIVAVEGANVTIDKSTAPDAPTVGTIGSFSEVVTETKASIRVTEGSVQQGNNVVWNGDDLKTIEGETTVFTTQTTVTTDSTNPASQLVVVEDSTLDNQGTINSQVQVDGTLKGTGTVNGTVNVTSGGRLVIGNSPGYMSISDLNLAGSLDICVAGVDTPSTSGHVGWESGTYSQLTLTNGQLALLDGASINILFGGDTIFDGSVDKEIAFDMAIITGISGFTINGVDAISATGTLTETAVQFLVDNTVYELTAEAYGLPTVGAAFSDFTITETEYSLEADGNGGYALHIKGKMVVPEPATTTLSLLALAALASRRRRGN